MRVSLSASLVLGLTGCNAILGIPDAVEILCESGEDCPGGFCGEALTCDARQWAIAIGDDEDQRVHDAVWYDPDREGEAPGLLLLAGSFTGELDLGPDHRYESQGGWDAYVAALDTTGQTVWSQHFSGPGEQRANAIAVGEQGATYVIGPLGGDTDFGGRSLTISADGVDGYLARLDPADGDVTWVERFGGTNELDVADVAVIDESPLVVGTYRGPWRSGPEGALDNGGLQAGYLASYDPTGTQSISSDFGSTEGLRACCALVDPLTDALLIGGSYEGDLTLGGEFVLSSGDGEAGYILTLESDGAGGTMTSLIGLGQPLAAFGTDSLSRLAIGMPTRSEPGLGVYRLLSNQVTEAVRAVAPEGSARLVALENNRDNATFALGSFTDSLDVVEGPSFEAQEQDLFVLTIDEEWRVPPGRSRTFAGEGEVTPVAIAADDDGHVMIVGSFDGSLTFSNDAGQITLQSRGGTDVFVAQLRL